MAGEEDAELRDLVTQTLENKGVLGKIRVSSACGLGFLEGLWYFSISKFGVLHPSHENLRTLFLQAQLRASVFIALEEQESIKVSDK